MRPTQTLLSWIVAIVATVLSTTTMLADAPGKPIEFEARQVASATDSGTVTLTWMANRTGGAPSAYQIYMAQGKTEDLSAFTKIHERTIDSVANIYSYSATGLAPGWYSFYITFSNADGVSDRSAIRTVEVKVLTPPSGVPGVPREFTAKVMETNTDPVVKLMWQTNTEGGLPSDFVIYIAEGETEDTSKFRAIAEVPAQQGRTLYSYNVENLAAGTYSFYVVARNAQGRSIRTSIKVVTITQGKEEKEKCGVIFGTVKGGANGSLNAVEKATVYAWLVSNDSTSDDHVFRAQVMRGTYQLRVPAGTYRLQVEGPFIYEEWYENVESADEATEIVVECQTETPVNFVVAFLPEPEMKTVTGRVYDAETNGGIANALVVFETRKNRERGEREYKRLLAETNADGIYTIQIPTTYTFIASAVARTPNNQSDLYYREWYNNTHDASQATSIEVTDNREGVDFPMDRKPVATGGFGGTMKSAATNAGVPGTVVAFMIEEGKDSSNSERKERVASVETDNAGNYLFSSLQRGTYIVFGMPGERPYAPGWHVMGATAAHSWLDASRIEVGDVMITVQRDILLDTVRGTAGRGHLRGWVKHRGGVIVKDDGTVQADAPVAGALATARDANGFLVGAAVSVSDGTFDFANLPLGTTSIMVDRVGFTPGVSTIDVTSSNSDVESTVTLTPIVTSVDEEVNPLAASQVYPNPATSQATIAFASVAGAVELQVVSTTGAILFTDTFTTAGGPTRIVLSTESLPSGMVLVQVRNGTHTFASPLMIVR